MYECIVEGSINVGNTEDVLAVSDLRAEGNGGLFLWGLGLFWWLKKLIVQSGPRQPTYGNTDSLKLDLPFLIDGSDERIEVHRVPRRVRLGVSVGISCTAHGDLH